MSPAVGARLGPYEIVARIGAGGMGVVWKARDTRLDRFVALRFLPADRMGDPDRRQRFAQEARTASALNHPNMVTIYEIGQAEGADFIAMEFVPGKPLDRLIPRKGMQAGAPAAGTSGRSKIRRAAALVLLLIGSGAYRLSSAQETPAAALEAVPLTTYAGYESSPSFSPDGNQVAFSWNGEKQDNFDIYVQPVASGSRPLRLTTDPADDEAPAWSPDGTSIAFVRLANGKAKLMLVPARGGPERELVAWQGSYSDQDAARSGLAGANWSPDGRWLVAAGRDSAENPVALWLISAESGEKRRLTVPPAGSMGDYCAAFSPDGRSVAFVRYAANAASDVYVLPLDGNLSAKGEPGRLTNDSRQVRGLAWTPDSREIVFSSNRVGAFALWRLAASGAGGPRRVPVGQGGSFPAISRQGNRLVYSEGITDTNIWRVNLSDPREPPTQLVASTRADSNPQYSPDGKSITFNSNRSGNMEVWVCAADGSNPRQPVTMGESATPRWSADGQRLVFDSNDDGHYQIYDVSVARRAGRGA